MEGDGRVGKRTDIINGKKDQGPSLGVPVLYCIVMFSGSDSV